MILSIYNKSFGKNLVDMEDDVKQATLSLRSFLYERVYRDNDAKTEEVKADRMLEAMFGFYLKHEEELPPLYRSFARGSA